MSDLRPTELQQPRPKPSEIRPGEKFKYLREQVKDNIPRAQQIQTKSGLPVEDPKMKRLAINMAVEALRSEIDKDTDPLTKLLNYSGFEKKLTAEVARAARDNTKISLVYLDANNLKRINDTLGHDAGSDYIKNIGQTIQAGIREYTDSASRWGGDEFSIILTNTNLQNAEDWWKQMAELFRQNHISIGAGVSEIDPKDLKDPTKYAEVIASAKKEADRALYVAKPLSKSTNDCVMITSKDLNKEALEENRAA